MPSSRIQTDPHTGKQYYLITNVNAAKADAEIDLHAKSWQLPYSIEDEDLTFDGKPLNMLYEENRWKAGMARDELLRKEKSMSSRGRSRQKK